MPIFVKASSRAKGYIRKGMPKVKKTYMVQARLANKFEDLYVKAHSPAKALAMAKKKTTLKHKFTSFSF